MKRFFTLIPLLILLASVPYLHGCGSHDTGTPMMVTAYSKCEVFANDTDVFQEQPADSTLTATSPTGGPAAFEPLKYVVADLKGNPRNGVCVTFLTNGIFYADSGYYYPITSNGGMTELTLRTDDSGVIYVYWSTESLPPAGTADQTGDAWVTATSGALTGKFTITWTVPKSS